MLKNVTIIRPILIILLVFYHSFAIYSGAWPPLENYPEINTYRWLDKLSYAFMLEMFVFISGYVLGYRVFTRGTAYLNAKNILWGKFCRLIIPSIIFSVLYIIMFWNNIKVSWQTFYNILDGVGHMWFLPMLYWCFVGVWVVEKLKIKHSFVLIFFLLCSLCSYIQLPLRLSYTLYYMFFFYCGYLVWRKNLNVDRFYSVRTIIVLFVLFVILFPTLTILCECKVGGGEVARGVFALLRKGARILYSGCGVAMLFVIVGWINKKRHKEGSQGWIVEIGSLCMSVYLFQQFILKYVYYYTDMPSMVSPYMLPWIGFVIALIGSLILAWTFKRI